MVGTTTRFSTTVAVQLRVYISPAVVLPVLWMATSGTGRAGVVKVQMLNNLFLWTYREVSLSKLQYAVVGYTVQTVAVNWSHRYRIIYSSQHWCTTSSFKAVLSKEMAVLTKGTGNHTCRQLATWIVVICLAGHVDNVQIECSTNGLSQTFSYIAGTSSYTCLWVVLLNTEIEGNKYRHVLL